MVDGDPEPAPDSAATTANKPNLIRRVQQRIDRGQQQRTFLSFPVAVIKKFGDDGAGSKAALIAYYGFFSLFPLLLVFVTVTGFVLRGRPDLQAKLVDSALSDFPVIGEQIRSGLGDFQGSGIALLIGVLGALWGGLGVAQAGQDAMNTVWEVPRVRYPGFLPARLRSLGLLALIGGGVIVTTAVSGFGAGGDALFVVRALSVVASVAINVGLFWVGFKITTIARVRWRDVLPGAVVGAALWSALQFLGSYYVSRQLRGASQVYGFFAVVIGLLSWLYIGAQIALFAAEINVVRARRLWPRSLFPPVLTGADRLVLESIAEAQQRRPEQRVTVEFDPPAKTPDT